MSARCPACGHDNADFVSVCAGCGVALRGNASNITPLAALMPEAEPPLPTAHVKTAVGRRDPTPGRVPLEPRRDPTPARVVAEVAPPPMTDAPGPEVDPTAWFDENTPDSARQKQTPSGPATPTPAEATATIKPRGTGEKSLPDPSLVSAGSFWRHALMAVALCLIVGAIVGWVLSSP